MSGEEPAPQMAPVESPQMISTVKLPMLKKGEYTLWSMRMEQYLTNTDYGLWQVIMNGDEPVQTTKDENGVETEVPPKTAQAILARQKERKAKSILLLAILDEYQLSNVKSKKMQKTVLKQQFKNFSVSDTEALDKAYDRFQKLISQLEVHGVAVSNKDANQKFLRALPSSWNNIALIMRNNRNVAFLSADTNSINEVNTANGVSTAAGHSSQGQASSSSYTNDLMFSFFPNQSSGLQLDDEDLEQIDHDNLEEMDIKWQVSILSIRVKRFYKKTERKLIINGKEPVGFDKAKVECFNYFKRGHFARECRAPRNQENRNGDAWYRSRDNTRRIIPVETSDALVVQDDALIMQDGLGYDWSYIDQDEPTEFALMAYTLNSSGSDTEVQYCSKNYVKTYEKLQKQFDEQRQTLSKANIEIVAYQLGLESVEAQLVVHQKNEVVYEEKIIVLKFKVKDKGNAIIRLTNHQISSKDKTGLGYGDQLNENDSSGSELFNSVFDCRSSDGDDNQTNDRFKKDNKYHAIPPPLTRNYVPPLVDLSFAGLDDSVYRLTANNTSASVSQVETSNTTPSNTSVEMPRVESVRPSRVIIKDWGNPQQALKYKGMFHTGCSRHMIGNKALLTDYQDIDGGFVAFGGSTRGGKITGIGKIRTNKIDFKDVFFVKELKFNLFSVSQMCDKKNGILFTETECLVLSLDFKLIDESQVLLRVPRQNNMYNFDLKNVVPSRDLTCLFTKSIIDESKLWHRRLGHVNFKTMNKLVKGNLVRGLPSKTFENDHTCVACQKGKQHKASCKTKHVSSISQPLQMLHMDLFGPTSVRSINHKTYCLVVTDDFSRFSWVFFLATKSETSGILKKFITEVENQLNHKVKVIRSDNGTEFKNREMDEFCGQKGIKREYSVARTPQQNGVAERKNRTLIEAARTMLADSLLPTVFWAEAVNTACYVLNRVLVTKPHNKTPYELIIGRAPSISFMRPFGCPVTILNTLDPLGKFDGKAEEGFLVGYSVNSKAFRVFNTETRKVEENLHVNFLENKPNVAGQGPNWLFDIDSLTNSMNYQPVTAGNQTNKNAGPQETNGNTGLKKNVDAGQTKEENVSTQQYIVFPLWSSISSNYKSSDDKAEDDTVDDDACKKTVQEPTSEYDQALKNVLDKMMDQEKEATEQSDAIRKEFEAQCDSQLLQEKITKASSTNNFNTVSTPVNTSSASSTFSPVGTSSGPSFVPFGRSFPIDVANLPHDPLIPELEDTAEIRSTGIFCNAYDDHDLETLNTPYADQSVGAEADFHNMEPSTVVEAMQEELLQFKIQKVWTLVDLPSSKKAIGTKWVYRNKKDERVEAMRLFLAFASFMNFPMYQMVVKSDFLYGTIEEEVYVSQPPAWYKTLSTYLLDNGFYRGQIDKTLFIKRLKGDILLVQVYVDDIIFSSTKKSLCDEFEQIMHNRFQMSSMGELTFFLGLQVKQKEDGIFISQDKYVGEILKKFGFSSLRTASTPMETNKALTKDEDGEDVDVHLYRSMIGSLMYLTSSRPDIMFSVCACSRFQVQPKVSHLNAVKRIFRYLKGQPKLGLWYPKDSPLILEAFSDSDYAGASLDRKSTTGGCQFLGSRLISWQCKKQTMVANSTTEAEYIAASHCCGQNPVYHSKTKHIEIRHHFIRDSYEKRLIEMVKIHTDHNVADLLTKAFDVSRFNFLVASIGKRGRDTKIPQSGGSPIKVDDEAVHKELGDRMKRAATTASSLEAE
ncbi:putative ribonuclease H-like domain-containing protein [Tanacetum coccineum]|uniref:Ribonuclease H-like domain-containing protein n=1 Tax=Tanacetum coccineum TaxID=301880 RepID=A0ABQ5AGF7_9ASTR